MYIINIMSQSVNTDFSKKTFTAFTDCILILM